MGEKTKLVVVSFSLFFFWYYLFFFCFLLFKILCYLLTSTHATHRARLRLFTLHLLCVLCEHVANGIITQNELENAPQVYWFTCRVLRLTAGFSSLLVLVHAAYSFRDYGKEIYLMMMRQQQQEQRQQQQQKQLAGNNSNNRSGSRQRKPLILGTLGKLRCVNYEYFGA